MKLQITNENIIIENKIYYFKNIKEIEFIEDINDWKDKLFNFSINIIFFGIIYFIMIVPIFFIRNIYTIILATFAVLGILASFGNRKTLYRIMIDRKNIYTTENEAEFLEIKARILKRELDKK